MKHSIQRQRGIGFLGLFVYLLIIIFVVTVVVRLGPHYMEYLTVRSLLKDLNEDPSQVKSGKRGVKAAVENRLFINDIRHVDKKAFSYTKTDQGVRVNVGYESREPLFGNVDIVLKFQHEEHIDGK